MTDTKSLRTGAGYALEVGLYATHRAMTEAADTIDTLRAQLAEAQRDAELERAIQKAAKDLPVNWSIHVAVERNAGWVELLNAEGDFEDFENADQTLAEQVISAIDAAKGESNGTR